jgi:hypothetical protein
VARKKELVFPLSQATKKKTAGYCGKSEEPREADN